MNAVDAFIGTGADGADALSEALDTESESFGPAAAASALEAYAAQFADADTADIDIENEEDLSTETVTYTGADLKAAPATLPTRRRTASGCPASRCSSATAWRPPTRLSGSTA